MIEFGLFDVKETQDIDELPRVTLTGRVWSSSACWPMPTSICNAATRPAQARQERIYDKAGMLIARWVDVAATRASSAKWPATSSNARSDGAAPNVQLLRSRTKWRRRERHRVRQGS